MDVIYLDNAASTWPKPSEVKISMMESIEEYAANPGRGGHQLAMRASKVIFRTRAKLAKLFHVLNPNDIVFTSNATGALNQGIKGLVKPRGHIITTTLEHNSVRRPIEYLRHTKGVDVSYIAPRDLYQLDVLDFEDQIKENTSLVVVNHASNLIGSIAPIKEIGQLCAKYKIPFMVDASQSAGVLPIDVQEMNISLLAFPGHKGLYGPQGTGGLYIHPDLELEPLLQGGTGSHSESIDQPTTRPDCYESGTLNTVGIAGLGAGVDFVLETGIEKIRKKEHALTIRLMEGLEKIKDVSVHGQPKEIERAAVVSFSMSGLDASEVAFILDQQYGIAVRAGFHCSPLAHETIGTIQEGAVRASFGYFNENQDVDAIIHALDEISSELHK
ncbi:MAG TPA: aminotransferase class V-fold PLP-dependent enzyme [Bacillota bacterium]|nr:aminotransferase class V-fold PLP-dependent enzyme [Bacillota bacterium]